VLAQLQTLSKKNLLKVCFSSNYVSSSIQFFWGVSMKNLNMYRLMLISLFAMLLAACVPWADFTVEPTKVVAGQVATFDASNSAVSEKEHGKATYTWNFGDGTAAGSGKIVKHTFASKGKYNVTLTITPEKGKGDGKKGTVAKTINVADPATAGASAELQVQAQGSDGVLIANAKVAIAGLTAKSNAKGIAALLNAPVGNNQAVTITKAGYVSQTVQASIAHGKANKLQITLLPVKEKRSVARAEAAQVIATKTLGASVTLPANALVNPNNQVATSAISANLSPFDIKSLDMSAMLGKGRGRDATGKLVNLISAGVFSIDFYDAQNAHLQLAAGKTADIQVDLPYASINGKALSVGTIVPLWHFDTAQGLWIAEGSGTVVASQTSSVGLAVKATVSHFSTWSWNFTIDNLGSVTVSCVDNTQQLTACDLSAIVLLPDNSYYYRNTHIEAEVTTVVNMPTDGIVSWMGISSQGQLGSIQTTTNGNVVVALTPAMTENFVQCKLADLSPTDCNVVANITLNNGGGTVALPYYIPGDGAWVRTALYTTTQIAWLSSTGFSFNGNGQLVRFEGSGTSAATGNVDLALTTQVVSDDKSLVLSCDSSTDMYPTGSSVGQANLPTPTQEALTSCNIGIAVIGTNSNFSYTSPSMAAGNSINLLLPPMAFMDTVYFGATGTTNLGNYVNIYSSSAANTLTNSQTVTLRLNNLTST
jgi:PKD domain